MYKELKGSDTLRQMYPKINDNTRDINARVDNIIQGQDLDPNKDSEIVDARLDSTDSTTYDTLKTRLDKHSTDIDSNTSRISAVESDTQNLDARTTTLEGEILESQFTPDIYNDASIFSAGAGTDENGNPLDYSQSIVNGQISVGLKGQTLSQLFKNGNIETSITSDNTTTAILIKPDGTWLLGGSYDSTAQVFSMDSNHKYFLYAKTKVGNLTNRIYARYEDGTVDIIGGTDKVTEVYKIFNPTKTSKANINLAEGDIGTITKDYQLFIDMTANGIEDYTEEQMLEIARGGYFEGTNSTFPEGGRYVSVGKNLFDGELELGAIASSTGADVDSTTTVRSKNYIPINSSINNILSLEEIEKTVNFRYYDANRSFINGEVSSKTPINKNIAYVRFYYTGTNIEDKIMLNKGTTVLPYEPYTESTSYITLPDGEELRSLPNGTKDEVSDGKLYKRISDRYNLKTIDITQLNTGYTNDLVFVTIPSDAGLENNKTGQAIIDGFNDQVPASSASYNDISNEYNWAGYNGNSIILIVPKGTYTDLADAQNDLVTTKSTSLIYQLANPPEPVQLDITPLTVFEGGQIYSEPYLKRALIYNATTGLDFPYSVLGIDKIETNEGIEVDLSTVTLASDGLSATISGAIGGESYMVYAPVRQENSTIPTSIISYPLNQKANDEMQNKSIQQLSTNVIDLQDQVAMLIVLHS